MPGSRQHATQVRWGPPLSRGQLQHASTQRLAGKAAAAGGLVQLVVYLTSISQ